MGEQGDGDAVLCWVCVEGSSRTRSRQLVRGCACRGTDAGFAHLSCLVEAATHDEDRWRSCQTCRQQFTGDVRLGLARARWELHRTQPDHDWQRLNAADSLASALQECAGDHAGALPLFQEVLAVSRRVDGDDDVNTLVSMNNLASLHQKMGNSELARPLFDEALDAQRRTLGEEAPDTLRTISNLAMLHLRTESFSLALPLAEEVLAVRRRTLGKEHADTLASIHNLGLLRWHMAHGEYVSFHKADVHVGPWDLKELESASGLLGEAKKLRCKVFGNTHQLTGESERALGYAEQRITELRTLLAKNVEKVLPSQPPLAKRRRRC
jgi:tetratricopeptide (TPR) repeat protein